MLNKIVFRKATNQDAKFIIPLIAESSGGICPAIWQALAHDGESLEASAIRYLTDPANDLSINNSTLAELAGQPAGVMITYQEAEPAKSDTNVVSPLPSDLLAALQPFREISDPDSLFISELCCLPESRGQGLGAQFLNYAKQKASESGLPRVSLRVFSANHGAIRLYEHHGFTIEDRRELLPHSAIQSTGEVFLMVCPV